MAEPVGKFFILDAEKIEVTKFEEFFNQSDYRFYEVLRVIGGLPLFIEEHTDRLAFALASAAYSASHLNQKLTSCITKLITANQTFEGNIMVLCNADADKLLLTAFFIKHNYPTDEMYRNGVKLVSHQMERPSPNLKQTEISNKIHDKLADYILQQQAYEVILVNMRGEITEGSKSNIFFLKGETLFTAPDNLVLQGITRKRIILLASRANIDLKFTPVTFTLLNKIDAVFLCGTSPKILPVNSIDDYLFNPDHPLIRKLSEAYNQDIDNYLAAYSTG